MNVHNVLVSQIDFRRLADKPRADSSGVAGRNGARQPLPGVQSAALVDTIPMRYGNNQVGYWPTPAVPPRNQKPPGWRPRDARLPEGGGHSPPQRAVFQRAGTMGNELVVVIDEVLAQHAFGGREPVGKRLWIPHNLSPYPVQSRWA